MAAVEKQRDEVTLKRDQRERLKEAEKEWSREAVGLKPECKCRGRCGETKAEENPDLGRETKQTTA